VLTNPHAMIEAPRRAVRIEKISIDCSLLLSLPTVAAAMRGRSTANPPAVPPKASEKRLRDQVVLAKPQMLRTATAAPIVEISIGR
jgi:hypothetical protein